MVSIQLSKTHIKYIASSLSGKNDDAVKFVALTVFQFYCNLFSISHYRASTHSGDKNSMEINSNGEAASSLIPSIAKAPIQLSKTNIARILYPHHVKIMLKPKSPCCTHIMHIPSLTCVNPVKLLNLYICSTYSMNNPSLGTWDYYSKTSPIDNDQMLENQKILPFFSNFLIHPQCVRVPKALLI